MLPNGFLTAAQDPLLSPCALLSTGGFLLVLIFYALLKFLVESPTNSNLWKYEGRIPKDEFKSSARLRLAGEAEFISRLVFRA